MNILLIHNYYQYFGGEDAYTNSLCHLLIDKGHKVIIYTKDSKTIKDTILSKMKIAKGMFWNDLIAKELSKIIVKHKPDIAHFGNINPLITYTAYHICVQHKIPIIQTVHNYRLVCPKGTLFRNNSVCELCVNKKFAYPAIKYRCYHNSRLASLVFTMSNYYHRQNHAFDAIDTYIFPSNFARDYYLEYSDIPEKKTIVIPYFVEDIKRKDKIIHKVDYFLFAGRLSEEKGILQLLDIFKLLTDIKLVVIGDGPLRDKVDTYKQYKNIIIKNFLQRDEIYKYMRNAIAIITPSLFYETGPIVMIESFTNNTPVIAPKFGSFMEAVKDGKTGFFYEQNNFEDLKSKILYAYNHRAEMFNMGQKAREEYEAKYTPEKHYQALMKVYDKTMNEKIF